MNLLKQGINAEQLATLLGDLLLSPIPEDVVIRDLNTDTRTTTEGQTFVALSGENFDGHEFINTAIKSGANTIIVERKLDTTVPQIVVSNSRLALGCIAVAIRARFVEDGGKIIGITGSVGKTTNKQMLASIFAQVGTTHATKGNLNNDLGVPFTWFDLPNDAEYAVIEMGANHQKEIDYLAKITQPQVAMITNAGEAHLEGFGGLDGVAKGKGELLQNLRNGDTAVINLDDNYANYWRDLLADGVSVKTFSLNNENADVYASNIRDNVASFTLHTDLQSIEVSLPTAGNHNIMNALGCTACALALHVTLADIAHGLANFSNVKGRLQSVKLGTLNIIDDTYNANPMSMRASANILASSSDYRIMVVGDMGELGDNSRDLHGELGRDLQGKADAFLCLGNLMHDFAENNTGATHYSSIDALNTALLILAKKEPHAMILVKGSRSMQMERVVNYLGEKYADNK